jgi:hypothetical protein
MWYDCLDNAKALHKLYNDIPLLENVRIASITLGDEGRRVKVIFDMPRHADYPPHRWGWNNVTVVELDFFGITELKISTLSDAYRGDIRINKVINGLLEVSIIGSLEVKIIATASLIQNVSSYLSN